VSTRDIDLIALFVDPQTFIDLSMFSNASILPYMSRFSMFMTGKTSSFNKNGGCTDAGTDGPSITIQNLPNEIFDEIFDFVL
jgi:hypothetical protein